MASASAKIWIQRLVSVGVVIAAVWARVVWEARAEWDLGQRQERIGEVGAAIDHYRRCARWYAPLWSYPDQALRRLWAIAKHAEKQGQFPLALEAYRSMRAAIYATRSFYTPNQGWLSRVNERIAHRMATLPPAPVYAHLSVQHRKMIYLKQLQTDNRPKVGWALLALCGFGLGSWGAARLFTDGIDDQWRWTGLRRWSWVIVLGFALFSIGLRLA